MNQRPVACATIRARLRQAARQARREILVPLLDFLLPSTCFGCGRTLGSHQRLGACAACWAALPMIEAPFCPGCGLARPDCTDLLGPALGRCGRCLLSPPAADRVCPAVAYHGIAREFLLRAKIGRRPELLPVLGRQLARVIQAHGFAGGCSLVVPVPSHPWARWQRGFDPAYELAVPVARALNLPLKAGVLKRRPLAGRALKWHSASGRRRLAARAFRLAADVRDLRVLLIDDVMTSGATVEACAALLRGGGAREVRAAVWARTPRRDPG